MSGCTLAELEAALKAQLSPDWVELIDESAAHAGHLHAPVDAQGVTHLRVRLAWAERAGLSRVAKHRLEYDALRDGLDRGLHALAIDWLDSPPAA